IVGVRVDYDSAWPMGIGTEAGVITVTERGDGVLVFDPPVSARSWRFAVALSASAVATVGKLWIAEGEQIPTPSQITVPRAGNVIVNASEARTLSRTRTATPTRGLSMAWPSLDDDEAA